MTERATSTLSAILIDDEQLAREELSYLLKEFPDVEILATGRNGLEAVKLIENLEPDVVFLDVQMPGLDGFGVIQNLREKNIPLPHFILATAYDQYAIQAFRWEALDYLLKPIEKDRLMVAVERARKAVTEKSKSAPQLEIAPLKASPQRTKLLVKNNNRNFIVDAQDVVYATIDDGLITVVATNVEGESNYRTIEELQSNLDPDTFWRVHRSFLVNIHRIKEVIPVVQIELPASHGRQEANRSARKPRANQTVARASETLVTTMSTAAPSSAAVTIRRATPEDAPACGANLLRSISQDQHGSQFSSRRSSAEEGVGVLTMMFSHPGFYCVVAEADGRIAGSNCLDERDAIAGVGPITIDPKAQNRGVGRKLMEAVLDRARERNFAGLRLVQAAFHNRSLSLYTTLGFDVREPLSVMQGPAIKKATKDLSCGRRKLPTSKRATKLPCGCTGTTAAESSPRPSGKVPRCGGTLWPHYRIRQFAGILWACRGGNQLPIFRPSSLQRMDSAGPGILVPSRNSELFRWCLANGLRVVQPMTLMSLGLYNEPQGAFLPSILY